MPEQPKQVGGGRRAISDTAPKLAELTDDVLFADVWNRSELAARDRSLITVAALIAGGIGGPRGGRDPQPAEFGKEPAQVRVGAFDRPGDDLGMGYQPQPANSPGSGVIGCPGSNAHGNHRVVAALFTCPDSRGAQLGEGCLLGFSALGRAAQGPLCRGRLDQTTAYCRLGFSAPAGRYATIRAARVTHAADAPCARRVPIDRKQASRRDDSLRPVVRPGAHPPKGWTRTVDAPGYRA